MTLPLGGWGPVVIAMNGDRFDGLSAEQQTALTNAVAKGSAGPAWDAERAGWPVISLA